MKSVRSWGRAHPCQADWIPFEEGIQFQPSRHYLPVGLLRSYGDSCLSHGNTLVDMSTHRRIRNFDEKNGILDVEAGASFDSLLSTIVPKGYFLPVTPGTKFVTVGGAIANDVHGKNHHNAGTFGCFVDSLILLRTDGTRIFCSQHENRELFGATIGGLGLTGFILSAQIRLKKIKSSFLNVQFQRFEGLEEYCELSEDSAGSEFTVAWLDCLARGEDRSKARGIFMSGDFIEEERGYSLHKKGFLKVPFNLPSFSLNPYSMRLFNELYYRRVGTKGKDRVQHYDPFFYPLDSVENWNRIYGRKGFHQYQCVVPKESIQALQHLLDEVVLSNQGSFLSVLKTFGRTASPGMLSFPIEGYTLCLDFPSLGRGTLHLMEMLDEIVFECGGRLYPAKDGRMLASSFQKSFPNWESFWALTDPLLCSDFSKRIFPAKAIDAISTRLLRRSQSLVSSQ